ncbi:energy transducer TonB [Pedobacter yonginense]|uniref:Energy transducer TonB n=1 Tax=Pedobacter yonginense TaxID=651869 RepID=A0A317EMP0_9SPHI|nr:TonB family protein [Pedobacter yonginense]PWS27229.1 energy transducer TonB [Pedobacter yonginense]
MKKLLFLGLLFWCTASVAQLQFKTGKAGFVNFLRENTVYPSFSKNNCIQGTVNISFKLDAAGKVYSSKVTKGIITELDQEALRLIRMSGGKWQIPAGYDTTTSVVVPVNFKLSGYNCERRSEREIQEAIRAYENEENLIKTVINFYKNIDLSKPGQEAQIIAIKNQLGIDDEYLDERIKDGLKKIKQGDKQGACEDFTFVKNMGSTKADPYIAQYCK